MSKKRKEESNKRKLPLKYLFTIVPSIMSILLVINQIIYFVISISLVQNFIYDPAYQDRYVDFISNIQSLGEESALSTIIGLFAVVVSVWVSLSIYNIIEKRNIEKAESNLQNLKNQMLTLQENYSTFAIKSLGYIRVGEDRINNSYIEKITNILQIKKYPIYLIATSLVRIENILTAIVNKFNKKSYFQMEEYLKLLSTELDDFESIVNNLAENHFNQKQSIDVFNSFLSCRRGEYNYYLYFWTKHEKENNLSILLRACDCFESALKLCPDANQKSGGYIDNALAYLYLIASQYKKSSDISKSKEYIALSLSHARKSTSYDSHYCRSYRNYGVILENYSIITGEMEYRHALDLAYEQYQKALKYDSHDYNSIIALVSCFLKKLDIDLKISNRTEPSDMFPISSDKQFFTSEKINELVKAYNYLFLSYSANPSDVKAHYHMVHVLMYIYLSKSQKPKLLPFTKQEIISKAKDEIEVCEAFYYDGESKPSAIPFWFKSRNFYECIGKLQKAKQFNDKILNTSNVTGDAQWWDEQYEKAKWDLGIT